MKIFKFSLAILIVLAVAVAAKIIFRLEIPYKTVPRKIEKIYVINLDARKDRWNTIDKSLKQNNVQNYVRFSAVNGLAVKILRESTGEIFTGRDLKEGKKTFLFGEKYKILCGKVSMNYAYEPWETRIMLTAGEIGCYCSHLEVMFDIAYNGYLAALVLEDDAVITEEVVKNLANLEQTLYKYSKWDILHVGYHLKYHPTTNEKLKLNPILFNNYYYKANRLKEVAIEATHGYLTNFHGAATLLRVLPMRGQIDRDISYSVHKGKINAYVSKVNMIQYEPKGSEGSDITLMGRPDNH